MSQPEHPSLPGKTDPLRGRFQVLNWLVSFYLVSLLVWFSLYRFSGDRFAVVSLLTMGVVYAFVPLPLALAWAIKVRPNARAGFRYSGLWGVSHPLGTALLAGFPSHHLP